MSPCVHIVGAGLSGLAAALLASGRHWRVVLHESTRMVGGRCRTIQQAGRQYDNGTHVLLQANRQTLRLLQMIGAEGRWAEPEPDGLPIVNLAAGKLQRIVLSPWQWLRPQRRPPGLSKADLLRLAGLMAVPGSRTVAECAGGSPDAAQLLELMTAAVLNTQSDVASARMLARVLRRMLAPESARLLVARTGLGPDLIEPLFAAVAKRVEVRFGQRLRKVRRSGENATGLVFGQETIDLAPSDRVILALPPARVTDVLPGVSAPDRFSPIVNLHFPLQNEGPIRFVGITGGLSQWLLVRSSTASVTLSAATAAADLPAAELARRVGPEVQATARLAGIGLRGLDLHAAAVVKERLATPVQDCRLAAAGPPPRQPLANLMLTGDWTTRLPATIEAAVTAAVAAVRRLGSPGGAWAGLPTAEADA